MVVVTYTGRKTARTRGVSSACILRPYQCTRAVYVLWLRTRAIIMAVHTGRNYGPCTRAVSTATVWPVNVARVHGRSKDTLYTREARPVYKAVLTARIVGRVHGRYLRPVTYSCTRAVLRCARHTLLVFTARKRGPSLQAVFTARDHGSVYRA